MMEKIKSAALVILVAASLIQTYFLAYGMPEYDRVAPTDYVQSELDGTQADLGDLLFPEEIVLHSGKMKHSVLLPNIIFYDKIYEFLKQRTFAGFRKTNALTANLNWNEIRDDQPGLEIRFKEGLPVSVLKNIMQIKDDSNVIGNDLITRIWIFNTDKDEARTYFFTDNSAAIYEAVKADVNTKDVEKFVGFGNYQPSYHVMPGDYYLPDEPVTAVRMSLASTSFSPDKLKSSLFADPEQTRFLVERDGSQIYTDGKRGLQIKNDLHWFSYSDPVYTSPDSHYDLKDNLLSAVQFVNQHGGWNGTYLLSESETKQTNGTQPTLFREYIEGLPVVGTKQSGLGLIRMQLDKGVVTTYERSLLNPEGKGTSRENVTLPGGKDLDRMVDVYAPRAGIREVFLAYKPLVSGQSIELEPCWVVRLVDGTVDYLASP